jgi:hypothetical protein
MVGEVGVVGDALKGRTRQFLHKSLGTVRYRLESIGLAKSENVWGTVVRILGGGGNAMTRRLDHDGSREHPSCPLHG